MSGPLYTVHPDELTAATEWTSSAIDAGALASLPLTEFAVEDVTAAHDALENWAVGKVLLRL